MERETQNASAVSQSRTQITEEQLSHDKQQEGMSFHACFSLRAMGSASAKPTCVGSSARPAGTASSTWRTQITLAAKVSPLRGVSSE